MSEENTSNSIIKNSIWRFLERFGAQIVSIIVSIVLARLLDPSSYGVVAIVTAITTILQVFIDGGLGNALIQKKDAKDEDFSTVFYFNLFTCIILYLILFFAAKPIANLYEISELTPIIRVLGLMIVISGFKNIQQAYVSKTMQFKKFFFSTLFGTVVSAILGILFAILGYGVWALVIQILSNTLIDTIVLWFTVKWKPIIYFSFKRLKILLKFGFVILASKLLSAISEEFRTFFVGKAYDSSSLAFYNKGYQFPGMIEGNVVTAVDSVLFPAMSREQDNLEKVKSISRKSIQMSTFCIYPILLGMFITAPVFIPILLGQKWINAVQFLQVFCVMYLVFPMLTAFWNSMKSIGKVKTYFFIEIFRIFIGVILLLVTYKIDIFRVALGYCLSNLVSIFPIVILNKKYLNYKVREQIKDFYQPLVVAVLMCCVVFPIKYIPIHSAFILTIQVFVGAVFYFASLFLLKNNSLFYIVNSIKRFKNKKQNEKDNQSNS